MDPESPRCRCGMNVGACPKHNPHYADLAVRLKPRRMSTGATVAHVAGRWPCGCDDTEGTVTKLEEIDEEPMAFVGTPCGWQWFPVEELRVVSQSQ